MSIRGLGIIVLIVVSALSIQLLTPFYESEYSNDTSLSDSNATFIGEGANNDGYHVASAGDVNGDGLDDILIGAHRFGFGGSNAGKTYLFFGKIYGWNQNIDLSKADVSFNGERIVDLSGYSISGVGDVNGDGYDDYIIGA